MDFRSLQSEIENAALGLPPVTLMEVCGTHTHAVRRLGIRQLLPGNVRLISGPGCPVCVTDESDLARALYLAKRKDVVFCCFGDMLRVPVGGESLLALSTAGADVRACVSPMDALRHARETSEKSVVWFGVGFETTSPHSAALVEAAAAQGIKNLSMLSAHKTMPPALRALLRENNRVDGLVCPGHVAAVAGAEAFRFVPEELHLPAAVAGFGAEEILLAILALVRMVRGGRPALVNAYPRAVTAQGNATAQALVEKAFEPCDALWRGLGRIENSGLRLRAEYGEFDAAKRFSIPDLPVSGARACRCAEILRGLVEPFDCPLFGAVCTPGEPVGACMVSAEGACAAYYNFGGEKP